MHYIAVKLMFLPSTTYSFCKILKGAQTLHLDTKTPRKNEGTEKASALMMQLPGRQVKMTQWTERDVARDTAPIFLTELRLFPTVWCMCNITSHTGGHTIGSRRDTRLCVRAAVWVREVYWQRRGVFPLLDTKIEWMVHVNYKSAMNHLVFS